LVDTRLVAAVAAASFTGHHDNALEAGFLFEDRFLDQLFARPRLAAARLPNILLPAAMVSFAVRNVLYATKLARPRYAEVLAHKIINDPGNFFHFRNELANTAKILAATLRTT
jgi:hypothetical protein